VRQFSAQKLNGQYSCRWTATQCQQLMRLYICNGPLQPYWKEKGERFRIDS